MIYLCTNTVEQEIFIALPFEIEKFRAATSYFT